MVLMNRFEGTSSVFGGFYTYVCKSKAIPLQALTGSECSRRLRFPDFKTMNVARLSALRTGRLYPQKIFLVLIAVKRLSGPQGHSAAGRIMSIKNSNDTIGNRTRDLPACSTVPQPTVTPRAPRVIPTTLKFIHLHASDAVHNVECHQKVRRSTEGRV
jgi:hypothetical protein